MNSDGEPALDGRDDRLEQQLRVALAAKPSVAVAPGFAHRIAVVATAEALQTGGRVAPSAGHGWAGIATVCSMVLLVIFMFGFAKAPPGAAPVMAEITLSLEFVVLLLGMVYFRRGLE